MKWIFNFGIYSNVLDKQRFLNLPNSYVIGIPGNSFCFIMQVLVLHALRWLLTVSSTSGRYTSLD